MLRKLEIFLGSAFVLIGIVVTLYAGLFSWWQNPELTQMQLFQQNWGFFVFGVMFIIAGFKLAEQ